MAVPRTRKKKRVNVPTKPEQNRIMEANWLCIAVAAEQMYTDYGWRTKRINNIVDGFWEQMTEAQRLQNEVGIKNAPVYMADNAGKEIDMDIIECCKMLDPYRGRCYMLCVGCLVMTLRKLKVSKLRCKLIVGAIFYERRVYEPWSVYRECKAVTGLDVRTKIKWE